MLRSCGLVLVPLCRMRVCMMLLLCFSRLCFFLPFYTFFCWFGGVILFSIVGVGLIEYVASSRRISCVSVLSITASMITAIAAIAAPIAWLNI